MNIKFTISAAVMLIALGLSFSSLQAKGEILDRIENTPLPVYQANLSAPVVVFEDKTESSVKLQWKAVTNAVTYTVEYKLATETDWTFFGSSYTAGAVNISGLVPATAYNFRVKANATASTNESAWGTLNVTTGTKLDTPTGVTMDTKTSTTITLHWNGVEHVSAYIVSYEDKTEAVGADDTQITLTDLNSDTDYSIRVQALGEGGIDAVYTASDKSAALNVKTMHPLSTPSLTFFQKSAGSVTFINCSVTNGTAYTFEYKLVSETDWTSFETGYTDPNISVTGLEAGLAYDFRVKANSHDDYYQSDWGYYSVTTGIALATPSNVTSVEADRTTSSIGVTWDTITNAVYYDVYYGIPGGMENYIHVFSGMSVTIGNLSAGTNYAIKVQAIGTDAENAVYTASAQSAPITIKTKTKIAAPVIANNGVLDISVSLTWNAIDHATSYTVEQSLDGTTWNAATATMVNNGSVYTATVTNLTAATAYSFRVTSQSTDADYVTSNPSNAVTVYTVSTDTYVIGTVTLAVAHGSCDAPTVIDRTIIVTNGKWRVSSSAAPNNQGGSIILNGGGASFTDGVGITTVYNDKPVSVNFSGSGVAQNFELKLSQNFTTIVSLNQSGLILGGILANNFTDAGHAAIKFYLDGQDVTSRNINATWDMDQQCFSVDYYNSNMTEGTHTIIVTAAYNNAGTSEYAAMLFDFIVNPVTEINMPAVVDSICIGGTYTDYGWSINTTDSLAGTYNYKRTEEALLGYDSIVNLKLTVHGLPAVTLTGEDTLFLTDKTTLTATGGVTYAWSCNDAGAQIVPVVADNSVVEITPSDTGFFRYKIEVASVEGCIDSAFMMIKVLPCGSQYPLHDVNNNDYSTRVYNHVCWMTENLRATDYADGAQVSMAVGYWSEMYPDTAANIARYGRLYDLASATRSETDLPIQGACPEGWQLPTQGEYMSLAALYENVSPLQSANYWFNNIGTNISEFDLRPSGIYSATAQRYENLNGNSYFFVAENATETTSYITIPTCLYSCPELLLILIDRENRLSVRCVRTVR